MAINEPAAVAMPASASWPVTRDRSHGSSHVYPLPEDRRYPATDTEPERTFFADGSRVALRVYDHGSGTWKSAPRHERRTGTTYGFLGGPRPTLQGVIWDGGRASTAGHRALELISGPLPVSSEEASRIERWVTQLAVHYLAQTPLREGHPGPRDEVLEYRLATCTEPPPYFLYPRIRERIVGVLAERAAQATPGARTVLVEYLPWSGPRVTVPVAVGNRLMRNALSANCGAISHVVAIGSGTHYGQAATWVTVEDSLGTTHYEANEIRRWFVKVD